MAETKNTEKQNIEIQKEEEKRELRKLTELRQKILLIRLAGQRLLLNGNLMKERVFMSRLLQIILSGISLANYINGLQIHMLIFRFRS